MSPEPAWIRLLYVRGALIVLMSLVACIFTGCGASRAEYRRTLVYKMDAFARALEDARLGTPGPEVEWRSGSAKWKATQPSTYNLMRAAADLRSSFQPPPEVFETSLKTYLAWREETIRDYSVAREKAVAELKKIYGALGDKYWCCANWGDSVLYKNAPMIGKTREGKLLFMSPDDNNKVFSIDDIMQFDPATELPATCRSCR